MITTKLLSPSIKILVAEEVAHFLENKKVRRLEADFPSLVSSTKNTEIWENGHTQTGFPASSRISGLRIS